jgi:hypothetical protein
LAGTEGHHFLAHPGVSLGHGFIGEAAVFLLDAVGNLFGIEFVFEWAFQTIVRGFGDGDFI